MYTNDDPLFGLFGAFKNQQSWCGERISNHVNELAHAQPISSAPEVGKNL
jgi:hypothetical protein